jgi:hypothetical protein
MAVSDAARRNHDELFPHDVSTLNVTDPELIEYLDNFPAAATHKLGDTRPPPHAGNHRSLLIAVITQQLPFIGYPACSTRWPPSTTSRPRHDRPVRRRCWGRPPPPTPGAHQQDPTGHRTTLPAAWNQPLQSRQTRRSVLRG